ncbi:26S proteasome regulatory subunit 4-like [Vulpes lagopus]|uniref:26S proteasome regulatory subunit 4-like n=1 Tax=Vulpes lagopus TaxID=494514 RepID=UPI001BCA5F11|nr:26S proteasome regulatory subunit 4-like [Vulpes lagopus]
MGNQNYLGGSRKDRSQVEVNYPGTITRRMAFDLTEARWRVEIVQAMRLSREGTIYAGEEQGLRLQKEAQSASPKQQSKESIFLEVLGNNTFVKDCWFSDCDSQLWVKWQLDLADQPHPALVSGQRMCHKQFGNMFMSLSGQAYEKLILFRKQFGSELIQKYLGDGPKLVWELFRVAEEHAPSIVFIDEIDAIGTKRYDSNSGGEREIQRTMLELLNQLDGFDSRGDVKVIMATNRIETLDPALIRPGRIDRKIEFPLPDEKTKKRIFQIHTSRMTLADDVTLDDLIMAKDDLSDADIKAICTEAGLMALRERRMKVTNEDFKKSKENVLYKKQEGTPEGLYL